MGHGIDSNIIGHIRCSVLEQSTSKILMPFTRTYLRNWGRNSSFKNLYNRRWTESITYTFLPPCSVSRYDWKDSPSTLAMKIMLMRKASQYLERALNLFLRDQKCWWKILLLSQASWFWCGWRELRMPEFKWQQKPSGCGHFILQQGRQSVKILRDS